MKIIFALAILMPMFFLETAAAKGRLSEILEMVSCQVALESAPQLESLKPQFKIETERLMLTAVDMSNEEVLQAADKVYLNEKVQRMSGDYLDRQTVGYLLAMGVSHPQDLHGHGIVNLSITYKAPSGQSFIIGFAQIGKTDFDAAAAKKLVKDHSKWYEISYHLLPEYWSNGYASELAKGLVDHLMKEEKAEGVYAQTILANEGSGKVLKNAGFEEIDRRIFPIVDGQEGNVYYAIQSQNWTPRLQHGGNFFTRIGNDGETELVMIVVGEVETWTVFQTDPWSDLKKFPLAKLYERILKLRPGQNCTDEHCGTFVSVPGRNEFGGDIYTSLVELESQVRQVIRDGKFDRRLLGVMWADRWLGSRNVARLLDFFEGRIVSLIPDHFD